MVALISPPLAEPAFDRKGTASTVASFLKRAEQDYKAGNIPAALDLYDSAIEQTPNDAHLLRTRGLLRGKLDDFEGAIGDFDLALRASPNSYPVLFNKGLALLKLARYGEALECFDDALKREPKDAELLAARGFALDGLGRLEDSVRAFDASLALEDSESVKKARRDVLDAILRKLARRGVISWRGGKPKGFDPKVELTDGPPLSEWILKNR
jgi:tetratricopeptide (TPR) repeat protein